MQQSSKKTKLKNLRNVLQNPFAIKWSEKTSEEVYPVQNLLKEVLPSAKLKETEQRITFNKRKEVSRKDVSKKRSPNVNRSYLAIGFNHVIRSLEKGDLCCVLLASDIQPPLLTKTLLAHILNRGERAGDSASAVSCVPTLILPDLRAITKSALGYAAMTVGLKNVAINPDNIFNPVFKLVSLNPTILETQPLTRTQEEETVVELQPTGNDDKIKATKLSDFKPENVYLYRKNKSERAFIPEVIGKIDVKTSAKEIEGNDFVSLEDKLSSPTKTSGFMVFRENPTASVVLAKYKQEKSNLHNWMEDDDDDSSDCDEEKTDNVFFIDSKRDDSLVKTYEKDLQDRIVHNPKQKNAPEKPHILQQGISRMFQTKDQKKFKANKQKKKLQNKVLVNYLPLKLKTITGNIKRANRKSK